MQWLFECHHRQRSRVFTINERTYQVCFDCGSAIDYSWERMASLHPNGPASRLVPMDNSGRVQSSII